MKVVETETKGSNAGKTFYALRTERFLHKSPIIHNLYLLKVWSEFTLGGFHREAATLSKFRRLPAILTLCHLYMILSNRYSFFIAAAIVPHLIRPINAL